MGLAAFQKAGDFGRDASAIAKAIKSLANRVTAPSALLPTLLATYGLPAAEVPATDENAKHVQAIFDSIPAPSVDEVKKASGGLFDDATCAEVIATIKAEALARWGLAWLSDRTPANDA